MPESESRDPQRVRQMFDGIARRYDLLNHLLSANLDRGWRRAACRELQQDSGATVLDLCGGTGDLSVELLRSGCAGMVVCCDFSHAMLQRAGAKFARRGVDGRCLRLEGDGLRLPLAGATVDAITVGFGVRNLADMDAGFREMLRVLAPGGRLVVLEFSRPEGPLLSRLYRFFLGHVLPRIGDRVSGSSGAYGYLARTISDFPLAAELAGRIRDAGFAACGWRLASGGIVAIHTAFKAA